MSATSGQRFDYQAYTEGQRGGLSLYPYCGIINGLQVSTVAIAGTGNVNLTMNVSAGAARLDGQYCSLAAGITTLVLPVGLDLNVGDYTFNVWLNARRLVPAQASAPGAPATNDKYIKVVDKGSYLEVDDILYYTGSVWAKYNAISGPPALQGHNNLPLNEVNATIHNATSSNQSFALTAEKPVYHKTNYPVGLSSPGAAYLRQPAAIKIATINIANGGTITSTIYGDEVRIPI
ncbi:hypothetical protein OsccyDRAFT_0680 [Leptolyngbyaceae cyanobacterium JSC-12]|nr:hypothetical protein OsccyDRAFT_0680 [Leptolyngbyaceae cyanobacterium JSC-12]